MENAHQAGSPAAVVATSPALKTTGSTGSVKLTPPANLSPPRVTPAAAPTATFSLTTIIAFSKRTFVPRRSSVCTMRTARTMLAASYLARRWLASATSTLLPHLQQQLRLAQGPESAPMLLMLSREANYHPVM